MTKGLQRGRQAEAHDPWGMVKGHPEMMELQKHIDQSHLERRVMGPEFQKNAKILQRAQRRTESLRARVKNSTGSKSTSVKWGDSSISMESHTGAYEDLSNLASKWHKRLEASGASEDPVPQREEASSEDRSSPTSPTIRATNNDVEVQGYPHDLIVNEFRAEKAAEKRLKSAAFQLQAGLQVIHTPSLSHHPPPPAAAPPPSHSQEQASGLLRREQAHRTLAEVEESRRVAEVVLNPQTPLTF